MIQKLIIFFFWLVLNMWLLPIFTPFNWIISLDDFFTAHEIRLWGSHEFGDERIYDLAADTFIAGSILLSLLFTRLTLLFIKRKKCTC